MGRARVWLQREVKLLGTPFDGIAPITGPGTDTGTPVAGVGSVVSLTDQVGGLAPAQKFHWRLRIVTNSPFYPHSPWMTMPGNTGTEMDFRTP